MTFLAPDGSYTQGRYGLAAAFPALLGDHKTLTDIENKFVHEPLDKNTVTLIGDPTWTVKDIWTHQLSSVQTVQFSVYTRSGDAACRSLASPLDDATTFVYPTGLCTEGIVALGASTGNLFGDGWAPTGIESKFFYKPIDERTVLFIGGPIFTFTYLVPGPSYGTTKTVESSSRSSAPRWDPGRQAEASRPASMLTVATVALSSAKPARADT